MILTEHPHQSHGQEEREQRSLRHSSSTGSTVLGAWSHFVVSDLLTRLSRPDITGACVSEIHTLHDLHLKLKRPLDCDSDLLHHGMIHVPDVKRVATALSDGDIHFSAAAQSPVDLGDPRDRVSCHPGDTNCQNFEDKYGYYIHRLFVGALAA